ncbi:CBN-PTR-22 protein [Caenorhabditis brenneri]|uniref:CBN-PTR-22 protein n=1 Tax=Caenorhabditis brenneri TaxID=135651 RepID=G0N3B4_CAEBE|nr:CBN-PTR-22 protein [Caenorhabditis brenneri]
MRLPTAKYEVHMRKFFYKFGFFIGTHPRKCIAALLLVTAVSCLGFLRFHQVLFQASDGGNLLRPAYRHQLLGISKEVVEELSVTTGGKLQTYGDMCEPYCEKNDAFFALMDIFESNSTDIEITYPNTHILGHQMLLANNIYGVKTHPDTHQVLSFTSVILRLYLTNPTLQPMLDFEDEIVKLAYDSGKYPLIHGQVASDNLVAKEVKRLGNDTAPWLSVALAILGVFLMMCSLRYRRSESKPLEACLGALIPVLSGLTTVGMVSATGLAFQSIIVSTLFLVIAIGIDDVFIILAAWHRSDKNLEIPERIALTVQDAGCSMTVTTVTNLVSFGNGVLSTTPVLQTFAIYSSVASVVCYIYQLVIFPAIVAITAPREYKQLEKMEEEKTFESIRVMGEWSDRMWHKLAAIIGTYWMRALTISILLGYWYLSVYGIYTMETDLSIQKMADKNARIVKFKDALDQILKEMQSVAILVKQPGDLRNPKNLENLEQLIKDFEAAKYSYGKESTICWLQSYLDFLSFYEDSEEEDIEDFGSQNTTRLRKPVNFTYTDLPSFLNSASHFKPMMRISEKDCEKNSPKCLESFIFTTGFTKVVRYNEMYPVVMDWRRIAANYPQFEVYPYTERSNFVDQTVDMVDNIWNTVISEVICMGITFVLFVPDLVSIFSAVFALFSVNFGVFGFLSLWGVGMDPVSTASLLMSIGFSVDISAHISYHYYQVDKPTARQKLEHVFTHIGWPTLQGGLSTMIAMSPIVIAPSYLGLVFLKTVVLVCTFGLIHGLIVLPVFLSFFDEIAGSCRSKSIKIADSSSPTSSCHNLPTTIWVRDIGSYKDRKF